MRSPFFLFFSATKTVKSLPFVADEEKFATDKRREILQIINIFEVKKKGGRQIIPKKGWQTKVKVIDLKKAEALRKRHVVHLQSK